MQEPITDEWIQEGLRQHARAQTAIDGATSPGGLQRAATTLSVCERKYGMQETLLDLAKTHGLLAPKS